MTDRRQFLCLTAGAMLATLSPRPARAILAADVRLIYEEIADERHAMVIGNPEGTLSIVHFVDYESHEGRAMDAMLQRLAADRFDLRILCKQWPRPGGLGELAARAAIAAHMQGGYAVAHAALMRIPGDLDERRIALALYDAGLDMRRLSIYLRERFTDIERSLRIAASQARDLALVTRPTLLGGSIRLSAPASEADLLRLIEDTRRA